MVRISVSSTGAQANLDSYEAAIDADGSVVAFQSNASNLVTGDSNGSGDIFVHDLETGTIERVSVNDDGSELGTGDYNNNVRTAVSADGNRVAFQSYGLTPFSYVLVRDRAAASTTVILPISFTSNNVDRSARQAPALSGNGKYVAFHSVTTFQNCEPPGARPADDDTNGAHDVFVYDLDTQPTPPTERISRDASGDQGQGDSYQPSLSSNGRLVAFHSAAFDLVAGDANDARDVFVKDRQTGAIERASVSSAGSAGNDESQQATISANGRFVVFRSRATNLVSADTNGRWDIFVHDRTADTTERVSVSSTGAQANHGSFSADVSDDGRFVVFHSNASNLVANDTNRRSDIFVHDRDTGQTARVSVGAGGAEANGHSYEPAISGDGNWIVFESVATNLVAGDTNRARDIFRVANPL